MTVQTLNDEFGLPGVLAFSESDSGLVRAEVSTPSCTAEFYLHGAHLTAWQPTGQKPVLFLSSKSAFAADKAIRGGVPVIFPWFGARSAALTGGRTDGPSHGFARLEPWTVAFAALSGDNLHMTLTLGPTDQARGFGYDHFQLAMEFIFGKTLTMRLSVANQAGEPLVFEEALHTYFSVGDAAAVRIHGLDGVEYLDKTEDFARKRQAGDITFTKETDRPYLNTTATVSIEDPALGRRIVVAKRNSETTVVWNPWSVLSEKLADMDDAGWKRMACVETANAAGNPVTLAPGDVHTMEAHISVSAAGLPSDPL